MPAKPTAGAAIPTTWRAEGDWLVTEIGPISADAYTAPDGRHFEPSYCHSEYNRAGDKNTTSEWNMTNIIAGAGIVPLRESSSDLAVRQAQATRPICPSRQPSSFSPCPPARPRAHPPESTMPPTEPTSSKTC